jgi:hypothetical protein
LSDVDRFKVAHGFEYQSLDDGGYIGVQGHEANYFFILLSGKQKNKNFLFFSSKKPNKYV